MEKYQKRLDTFFKKNDWPYWTPHEILARFVEETGELARLINHVYGPKKKKSDEMAQNMEEEIGDLIYTLICFGNSLEISLDEAIEKSMDKSETRDKNRFSKK